MKSCYAAGVLCLARFNFLHTLAVFFGVGNGVVNIAIWLAIGILWLIGLTFGAFKAFEEERRKREEERMQRELDRLFEDDD